MHVLVVAEHNNQALNMATLSAVAAATQIADAVSVLIAGSDCATAAGEAANLKGVNRVCVADNEVFAHQLAESMALLIQQLAADYTHILIGASKYGKNILPRAAALLDVAPVSDITAVHAADTFERPIYAGNAIATVQSTDALKFISVRPTAFEPLGDGGNATIEALSNSVINDLSRFINQDLTRSERPELASARIVISGGRGMQSGDNFGMLEQVADQLGAAVGASRAAVDAGFAPNNYQVGQTGKVVAPDLYIAVGISGAIQHLAGMKESKIIVAINKDEEAPIFQVADYGLVADLFQAIPELGAELKKQNATD